MSLQTQIQSFVLRAAQEFNAVSTKIGSLASLSTTDKTSLVSAINELKNAVNASTSIDDSAITTSTTYSSSKIVGLLDALKADILGGADAAFDTLLEIQQALQTGESASTALLDAVNKRVRYDAAQALTAPEQAQARSNIGAIAAADVGDTAFDFVAAFEAALI
jgi:capsid protein